MAQEPPANQGSNMIFREIEDRFMLMSEQGDFLNSLFPSTDLIGSSLAALQYACRYCASNTGIFNSPQQVVDSRDSLILSSNGSHASEPSEILCLVLGEGSFPRTAILAAICQGWVSVAIDEDLHPEWRGIHDEIARSNSTAGKYFGFQGSMKDFLANGRTIIQATMAETHRFVEIIMIGIESENNSSPLNDIGGLFGVADLRELYARAPVTVVSISSEDSSFLDGSIGCQNMNRPFSTEPKFTLVDTNLSSPYRHLNVWRFPSSGAYSTSSSSRSARKSSLSSSVISSSSLERMSSKEHLGIGDSIVEGSTSESILYGRNTKKYSRVAQLQLQQALAAENRYVRRGSMKENLPIPATGNKAPVDGKSSILSFLKRRSQVPLSQREQLSSSAIKSKEDGNIATPIITNIKKSPTIPKAVGYSTKCESKSECVTVCEENQGDNNSHQYSLVSPSMPSRSNTCASSISSLDVTYTSTFDSDETQSFSGDLLPIHSRHSASSLTHQFHEGDIVEVRIDNICQMGVVETEPFHGFYNVKLLSDTPAWNNLRSKVDLYTKFYAHGILPEVPARQLLPFRCANPGDVLNVWVKGKEYSFQIQGLEDGSKIEDTKYIVRFADKTGSGWRQIKHRVAVNKAYYRRVVFDV